MSKTIAYFQLPKEADRYAFWDDWNGEFAHSHRRWPGIKKYEITQLLNTVRGNPENSIHGMAEFWWESKEAMEKDAIEHAQSPERQRRTEEFEKKTAWMVLAEYEEKIIIDAGLDDSKMVKRVAVFQLKKDADREAFYKHWFYDFAPTHHDWPGLKKYTINRLVNVRYGDPAHVLDGIAELWFENEAAYDADLVRHEREAVREQRTVNYETTWLTWMNGMKMEQKVIIDKTR
jgi:uncharacterized protein (TIGR02118 family)